jgi:propionyl-CoA carboxylase alpha chain
VFAGIDERAALTMIRKILIANRGVIASRIIRTCRRLGISTVSVYSDADKESPHARLADEAVSLGPSNGPQVYMDRERMLEAGRLTNADAVHPGCDFLAADADFAAACEDSGLTFIGPSPDILRAGPKARELARSRGIRVASEPPDPAARQIEFQILGDKHGNVIHLIERDGSIQSDGRKLFSESPSPSLSDDLRARMGETAVMLAREIGYYSAATVQFLLTPSGEFHYLGGEPFLSAEHAVTEAATGLHLIELQIEVAEGRRLPGKVPRANGHAIVAGLYTADAPGADLAKRTLHVWNPPPGSNDLRIDAGVGEGMQVPPYDPLLAELICLDTVRDAAIRKLGQSLKCMWVGGVETNQEVLIQILESQDFRDGNFHVGFLESHPLKPRTDEASDLLFAAAWVLYFENSRHAQRSILTGVPPHYRNTPYRDPFMTLRMGTTELAVSWRRLSQTRYLLRSGGAELDGEVLEFQPGAMSVVISGIRREFQFREIPDTVFVHSSLGSRVIHRLPRYPRPEKSAAVQSQTVRGPSKSMASSVKT